MIDLVGHQLGNYRVLRRLGRGGFADVYLGEQIHLKSAVALKVVRTLFPEEQSAAFLQEARILVRLRHPHIVRVLDFGVEADIAYLVLEYAPGGTLRTLCPKGARIPLDMLLRVAGQAALALQYAHDQGLVHRDVKPENLLLGQQGEVLLSDFGLAVFAPYMHLPGARTGMVSEAGTSPYLAPEQPQGRPQPASDQYALGAVLYEWLTGTPPFPGAPGEIALQHLSAPLPALRQFVPDLSPAIEEVVLRALAKEPEQRFACVRDLAIALERAALGAQAAMPSSSSPGSAPEAPPLLLDSGKQEAPPFTPILRGNAPIFLTPLLGREQEVERASALLQRPDVRILTLVGPGGVGKTRLGLAVATSLCVSFEDGVCCVSLATISDPELVLPTIARQLEVKEEGERPLLDLLIAALRDRHLLLLLDNLEQIVTTGPRLSELLAICPRLKLLITSRVLLHLDGEHAFPVSPLPLPDLTRPSKQENLAQLAAVQLFLQRAQAVQPDFLLTDANLGAVAEICVRLDGLPLAIELAAARTRLLSPHTLLTRLANRLSILTRGAATLPERQQTLRKTLQWSYDLLDVHEQRLFRQLSIFVGGFTLEAAEAVCGALRRDDQGEDAAGLVLDGVESLLERSLLYQVKRQGDDLRLAMLETIREYGLERLVTSGELESSRQAHARYYQALAREAGSDIRRPEKGRWLDRLEQEQDNLRTALNGLLAQAEAEQALLLCNDLFWFWWIRDPREGRTFLERGLVAQGSVARDIRGWALQTLGILVSNQGNYAHSVELMQASLALFHETGGTLGRAWALSNIGVTTVYQGEYTKARQVLEESLALFRELEDRRGESPAQIGSLPVSGGVAFTLFRLASIANLQGEYARARALAEESLPLLRTMGDSLRIPPVLEILASAALNQGDYASAQTILAEKLTIEREEGIKRDIGLTLALQGQLAFLQGETSKAHAVLTESITLLQEIAVSWMPSQDHLAEALSLLGRVVTRQGDFSSAQTLHEESLTAARHMAKPRVIAFGLEGLAEVVAQGKPAWAARLWGAAEGLRETTGTPLPIAWHPDYERAVAAARAVLGEQAFLAHWAAGRTLPLEKLLAERELAPLPQLARAAVPPVIFPARLTPRERDVLYLLAQGLTSPQIAEQLVIGLVTVNAHIRSIYNKLGVNSRAAATRYSIEHNLT